LAYAHATGTTTRMTTMRETRMKRMMTTRAHPSKVARRRVVVQVALVALTTSLLSASSSEVGLLDHTWSSTAMCVFECVCA